MVNNQRPSASKQAAASQNFQKQGSKYSFSVVVWIWGFQPNIPLPEKNNYKCIYICMSGSICSIICILGRTGNLKRLCSNASKDKPHMILTQHRSFREVFTKGVETFFKETRKISTVFSFDRVMSPKLFSLLKYDGHYLVLGHPIWRHDSCPEVFLLETVVGVSVLHIKFLHSNDFIRRQLFPMCSKNC